MKVLLLQEKPTNTMLYLNSLPPLGLLYIASFLESKGISCDVIDKNSYSPKSIGLMKYDLIGFSVNSANIQNSITTARDIKKLNKNIIVIFGGSHPKLIAKKLIMNDWLDAIISDEGEDLIYDYIKSNEKQKIKGIWIKKNNQPYYTGYRSPINDLDSLPFPAIDKIKYRRYNMVIKKKSPVFAINTSRGCPHGCIFCHHSLGYKYRFRSPENVVEEILILKSKYGIKELWVTDDSFTEDMKRAEKICDLIIEKKIDISISLGNGIRADRLNEALVKKMRKAGVWLATIAPEVGNEDSLLKIKKGFKLKDAANAVKLCKKYGIRTQSAFIIGFPWENEKSIEETIAFSKMLDTDFLCVNRLHPYPGTPIWDMTNKGDIAMLDEKKSFIDERYKHANLSEEKMNECLKKFNRSFYTPLKVLNILRLLGIKGTINMGAYALLSKSI